VQCPIQRCLACSVTDGSCGPFAPVWNSIMHANREYSFSRARSANLLGFQKILGAKYHTQIPREQDSCIQLVHLPSWVGLSAKQFLLLLRCTSWISASPINWRLDSAGRLRMPVCTGGTDLTGSSYPKPRQAPLRRGFAFLASVRFGLPFQPVDATPPFSRGKGLKPKAFLWLASIVI